IALTILNQMIERATATSNQCSNSRAFSATGCRANARADSRRRCNRQYCFQLRTSSTSDRRRTKGLFLPSDARHYRSARPGCLCLIGIRHALLITFVIAFTGGVYGCCRLIICHGVVSIGVTGFVIAQKERLVLARGLSIG